MDGRNKKAAGGKWIGWRPVYGYKKIGRRGESTLEIDPLKKQTVLWIFENYIGRNGKKRLSLQEIAIELNSRGIPSPNRGNWYGASIDRLITNRTYIGELIFKGANPKNE